MPRYSLRTLFIITTLAAALFALPNLQYQAWVGHFKLSIKVESSSNRPIHFITFQTYETIEEFKDQRYRIPEGVTDDRAIVPNDDGEYLAYILSHGTNDSFGKELSYHAAPFIAVKIVYEDDEELLVLRNVPVGRGARSLTIKIP